MLFLINALKGGVHGMGLPPNTFLFKMASGSLHRVLLYLKWLARVSPLQVVPVTMDGGRCISCIFHQYISLGEFKQFEYLTSSYKTNPVISKKISPDI